jgi:DNA primase
MNFESYISSVFDVVKESGDERIAKCPFCNDTKGHLYINIQKGLAHCFRCGYSATAGKLVQDTKDLGYSVDNREIELSGFSDREEVRKELALPRGYIRLDVNKEKSWFAAKVRSYLNGRGITDDLIRRHKIGYCVSGRYAGRCIIPFFEEGKLCYFIGRSLFNSDKKVLNPPKDIAKKSEVLFNIDNIKRYDEIIICEGVFDAMSAGDNATCLLGKTISYTQLMKLLSLNKKRYIVMLDADAYKEALAVAQAISEYDKDVRVARLEKGDPNSNVKEEVERAIAEAERFSLNTLLDLVK